MEVPPCLICAEDLTDGEDFVVKKEVTSDCEDESCCRDDDHPPGNQHNSLQVNVATTINVKNDKVHHQQTGSDNKEWNEDEKCIFQLFLKWFGVPIKVKGKSGRHCVNLEGWDGNSKGDQFPFCTVCKKQLIKVLEMQRMVDELEKEINKSVKSIREKANSNEDIFENKRIYRKDVRYLGIRQRIVTDFKTRYEGQFFEPKRQNKRSEKSRISLRSSTTLPNYDDPPPPGDTCISEKRPVVLPSASNQTTVEQCSLLGKSNQKIEEHEVDFDTEFHHDDDDRVDSDWDPSNAAEEVVSTEINEISNLGRRKSKRNRKIVNFKEDEPAEHSATEEPDKSFQSETEDKGEDSDFDPESSSSAPKRKRKRRFKILVDEDYTVDEAEELMSCDDDDDDDADVVTDYGPKQGRYMRTKFDPEKNTATYGNIVFYQQSTASEKKYKCSVCDQELNNLRPHYLKFHSDLYACKHCEYRGSSRRCLLDHIYSLHKEGAPPSWLTRSVICRICEKPLSSKERCKVHEWSHKNAEEKREALERGGEDVPDFQGKHQCDKCGFAFTSQKALNSHKKHRHGDKETVGPPVTGKQCSKCGGTFLQLRVHQRVVHGVDARYSPVECTEAGCDKVLKNLKGLYRHVRVVHRQNKSFKCTMCPREFSQKKNLDMHMNLHLGIRPWQCDQCPMNFVMEAHLKKHCRTYHCEGKAPPKRKPFVRGPTMLASDVRKAKLVREGKYLPPSALATWAAGREPTSHLPVADNKSVAFASSSVSQEDCSEAYSGNNYNTFGN